MPLRLIVVEGADKGRFFMLPDAGEVTIGSSRKNAEIALNDLYVARLHCQLDIADGKVVLSDHDSPSGTLVNNQKVKQRELSKGDVVRLGNSHLRLEDAAAPVPDDDVPEIDAEVLPEVEVEVLADEANAAETVSDVTSRPQAEAAPPLPRLTRDNLERLTGHSLAHFKVGHLLVKGFHGAVFQAQNQKDGKWVALKVLSPDFPADDVEQDRFIRVIKSVLPVRHPNLVGIYGVGKTGPYCWIAMEHVDSDSLTDLVRVLAGLRKIDWRMPYRVAVHIGRALQCAHEHNIHHANITPKSILWQPKDKIAKLADLGLATALQGSVLRKNVIKEKVDTEIYYMAPEQTQPGRFVDGYSDLYSLGVVVYSLCTGHLPFVGGNQAETLKKIRETAPVPPTQYQAEIPPEFEKIILKSLAKDPHARYEGFAEFLSDLQKVPQAQAIEV